MHSRLAMQALSFLYSWSFADIRRIRRSFHS